MMGLRLVRPNSQRVWSLRHEGINPSVNICSLDDDNVLKQKKKICSLPLPSSERIQRKGGVLHSLRRSIHCSKRKAKNGLKFVHSLFGDHGMFSGFIYIYIYICSVSIVGDNGDQNE